MADVLQDPGGGLVGVHGVVQVLHAAHYGLTSSFCH